MLDAYAAGQTEPVAVHRVGPDLVFGRLWKELGIEAALRQQLESRRFEFDAERAVYLSVLQRLFASGSDWAAERWRESYCIPGTESLELHQLYRAMAFLREEVDEPGSGTIPGSPHCLTDRLEEALFEPRRNLFTELDQVFLDTASIYVEGEGDQQLGQYGKSKDHGPDLKQMVVGMVFDLQGRPICCELRPGNTADVKSPVPVVRRMQRRFGVRKVTIVADRGMISAETIAALDSGEMNCDYILGARMRSTNEVSEVVLNDRGHFREIQPERQRPKGPVAAEGQGSVREGSALRRLPERGTTPQGCRGSRSHRGPVTGTLARRRQGVRRQQGYRNFLREESATHFLLNEEKVKEKARYNGHWVLRTNLTDEPELITMAYKQLRMVEDVFRTMKSTLETRPIHHKRDQTILGHVFCSFLAPDGWLGCVPGTRGPCRRRPRGGRPGGSCGVPRSHWMSWESPKTARHAPEGRHVRWARLRACAESPCAPAPRRTVPDKGGHWGRLRPGRRWERRSRGSRHRE